MADLESVVDRGIEGLVLPSMTSAGIRVRRRLGHWPAPERLDGRHVVITGATSGIGKAAAHELAELGASLTIVARSRERAEALAADLSRAGGQPVDVEVADMADLAAVRAAADAIAARHERVDVLIHNAGALSRRYTTGPSGIEQTVASQVIAVWLMTEVLLPRLRHVGTGAPAPRVLTMTSGGMYTVRHDLARLEATAEGYDGRLAYARAKRAQIVLTVGSSCREALSGPPRVRFHAVHPGWVDTGGLAEGMPGLFRLTRPALRTPAEGADTLVWLAGAPEAAESSGLLWHDRRPRPIDRTSRTAMSPAEMAAAFVELEAWCAAAVARAGVEPPTGAP